MPHPKSLLAQYGLVPKKSLGQNFLFDDRILEQIVAAAAVEPADRVLEVGAGIGSLTRHLARAAAQVVAVELDQHFLPILNAELAAADNVLLVHGDILELDPARWFDEKPYKVVANIPYYITGAILRHLLGGSGKPTLLVLTLQKEVAQRIVAPPGEMTLLAVSVRFFGAAEIVGEISAGAFWPRPAVDSAILRVDLSAGPRLPLAEEARFFSLVRAGFSQKRKQLQKNLRSLGYGRPQMIALLRDAGIDPRRRAETLSIDEWLQLYALLYDPDPGNGKGS
jgi:16S rRNA (adenine1518-N6/adenine1519-N6)-dimethyltransferase